MQKSRSKRAGYVLCLSICTMITAGSHTQIIVPLTEKEIMSYCPPEGTTGAYNTAIGRPLDFELTPKDTIEEVLGGTHEEKKLVDTE
jgi:hypothetical protein